MEALWSNKKLQVPLTGKPFSANIMVFLLGSSNSTELGLHTKKGDYVMLLTFPSQQIHHTKVKCLEVNLLSILFPGQSAFVNSLTLRCPLFLNYAPNLEYLSYT